MLVVYREIHDLDVSSYSLSLDWLQLEIFVEEFVHQTCLSNVTVADDADVDHRHVAFFFNPGEQFVPNFVWI